MREGEEKDLKREVDEQKTEAKDKKKALAKKIVSHKGSDEKYLKMDKGWGAVKENERKEKHGGKKEEERERK